jgi:hypothetical protein
MNKRIEELALQAGYKPLHGFDFANTLEETYLKKFAQLIVRECADVCLDPNHWYEDAAGETFYVEIKKHFGVEE